MQLPWDWRERAALQLPLLFYILVHVGLQRQTFRPLAPRCSPLRREKSSLPHTICASLSPEMERSLHIWAHCTTRVHGVHNVLLAPPIKGSPCLSHLPCSGVFWHSTVSVLLLPFLLWHPVLFRFPVFLCSECGEQTDSLLFIIFPLAWAEWEALINLAYEDTSWVSCMCTSLSSVLSPWTQHCKMYNESLVLLEFCTQVKSIPKHMWLKKI